MFNIEEFKNSSVWDIPIIFRRYCDWCFTNKLDDDCDMCQSIYFKELEKIRNTSTEYKK